jgi:hypothetical protein
MARKFAINPEWNENSNQAIATFGSSFHRTPTPRAVTRTADNPPRSLHSQGVGARSASFRVTSTQPELMSSSPIRSSKNSI